MSSISLRRGDFEASTSLIGPSFDILDVFEIRRDPDVDDMVRIVLLVDLKVETGLFDVKADISFPTSTDRQKIIDIEWECFIIFFRALI